MRIRTRFLSAVAIMIAASAFVVSGATLAAADTCCYPDGTCQDNVPQQTCVGGGGVFFSGITCAKHPCPPIGACCESNGSCTISAEQGCINRGGTWQGAGTDCDPLPCPHACCFPDGSCQDLGEAACETAGGTFDAGNTCATVTCPQPNGACCFPDGSCQDLSEADCAAAGGVFNEGLSCALHPCPPPLGACCFPDGSCQDLNEADCVAAGGQFNAGVTCALHPCPQPPEEACPRTAGFWGQQCACADGEGGNVKYSCDEMNQIIACIDGKSSFFSWGNPLGGFCAILNPGTPMKPRQQAKRQFATMLASVCAGELGLIADNGDVVSLPESTPIDPCSGFSATTVGELIDEVDALLATLEGQNQNDQSVKTQYGNIITCVDRINNGGGGIPSCDSNSDGTAKGDSQAFTPSTESTSWGRVKGIYR